MTERVASSQRRTSSDAPPAASSLRRNAATAALLRWYFRSRRDLPWRRRSDPYGIWLSEVMLQQTTAAVVAPRFARFIKRFPTVRALARASERDVLAEWSGLGYYARARNLLRAAREIAKAGTFPHTVAGLRKLPGVGDYTAAAVASIAFRARAAAVDGNVARVLCRLFALRIDPRSSRAKHRLGALAGSFLSRSSPGDVNQAMMELGATVCVPRKPRCSACPVRSMCEGKRRGIPESFPLPPSKKPLRRAHLVVGLAFRNGRMLLVEDEQFVTASGHLILPVFEVGKTSAGGTRTLKENHEGLLRKEWKKGTGRGVADVQSLGSLRHSVLNRRYAVSLYLLRESPGGPAGGRRFSRGSFHFVRPRDVVHHARGGLLEKVLARWRSAGSPR